MTWNRKRRIEPISADEFFAQKPDEYSLEEFASRVYLMIHTYYLSAEEKIKVRMGRVWQEEFGTYLTNETFEYLLVNEPVMLRDILVAQTREKQEIRSGKYLYKSVLAFEFDLWLVENYRKKNPLRSNSFKEYILEKYGSFFRGNYMSFIQYDLKNIYHYERIAKELEPFYSQIAEVFELLVSNNRMRIDYENESADRTAERPEAEKPDRPEVVQETGQEEEKVPVVQETGQKEEKVPEEQKTGRQEEKLPVIREADTEKIRDEIKKELVRETDTEKIRDEIKKELVREYGLLLGEKDEKIRKLERDIKEFKRQRDDAREYSADQYGRGVKDLFLALNDIRYGKVIDYLYSLLNSEDTDDKMAGYLENFFMILEDMEIEPVITGQEISVHEETMVKQFNMDFDKSDYDPAKVRLKYAGWTYKGKIIEKPAITMKED